MIERMGRQVVIGIGNAARGDDAVGHAVVRRLRGNVPSGVALLDIDGEVSSLLACLDVADVAVLIDACVSGAPAGSVRRIDAAMADLPDGLGTSTHGLGLAEAVQLAKALGQIPPKCVVYAIEGASFEAGAPLSPPVAAAVDEVAARIRAELCSLSTTGGSIDA